MVKLPAFDIRSLTFLIADGDEPMRRMMVDVLRSFGITNVREAGNGEAALHALETFLPDIIICEWEIAKINGIDLTRRIRRDRVSPHRLTPIIFVTAHTQMWHVTTARDAGITEYLAKPISAHSIYARVCAVVEKPRPFIEAESFVGPDRRRRHDPYKVVMARRDADKVKAAAAAPGGVVNDDEIDAMLGF